MFPLRLRLRPSGDGSLPVATPPQALQPVPARDS
jgi:hypothetical protein